MKILKIISEEITNIEVQEGDERFNLIRDSNGDWSMVDGKNIDFISNSSNYEEAYQLTQNDQYGRW